MVYICVSDQGAASGLDIELSSIRIALATVTHFSETKKKRRLLIELNVFENVIWKITTIWFRPKLSTLEGFKL